MLTFDTEKLATFLGLRREVVGGVHLYEMFEDGSSSLTRTLLPSETLSSFTIENSAPKGKIFGFAISQKLTVNLIEQLPLAKGTRIQPYLAIKGNEDYPELPYFYVESVEIDEINNTTKITAYDMIYYSSNKRIEEVDISYPTTILGYAMAVVGALGGVCSWYGTDDFNIEEGQVNTGGTETIQEILGALAEAMGCVCFCSSASNIMFKALCKTPEDTILPASYFNFTSQEPIIYTKVASATQLGDNYISGEEEGFTLTIWDNPFLEIREDIASIVDTIQSRVCPCYMMPYTLESRGNPYYQIGDCISVVTPNSEQKIYWFNETLEYNGGLRSKTSWEEGKDERPDATPTSLGDVLKNTFAKVDKVNNEVNIVAGTTSEHAQAISALRMNADSINASITNLREATEGAMETLNGDIVTLTNKVEATMTSEAVDLKIQSAMAGGATNVTTSTGFTFNEAGLTVSKSGSEMTTRIDEDGMAVFRDNTEVLTADNQGVIAYNLHAKTYLIIGDNSRFEDYTSINGEARTGCFWIGG